MTSPELDKRFIELLAEEGNGAVEAYLPDGTPLRVVIIGPIKTWWGRIHSDEYLSYAQWRDAVRVAVIREGHLTYSPHRAWQGAWHEVAQKVNNVAIIESDVVIVLTPDKVESVGTLAEIEVAHANGIDVIFAPPGTKADLDNLLAELSELKTFLNT